MDDQKIVELYLNRDESAIRHTADKYGSRLRSLSLRIVEDPETAEECENDTYMQAWSSIPPHKPTDYLFAFLAKITRQLSLNRCREMSRLKRNALVCQLSEEMEQCIPSSNDTQCQIDTIVLSDAINGFLGNLSREKRIIFLRRYWYMDSIADISNTFGISQSKVKTMLFRMRNQLRQHLIKEGYIL